MKRKWEILLQSSAVIARSNLSRYYIRPYDNSVRKWIKYQNHNKTPYLALTGELWGVYCEEFGEKWPRYNGTALYFHLCPGCLNPIKLICKVYLHGCCMNKDVVWTCIIRGLSKSWDVMTWVDFTHYWHFVRGIHRSPVHSPHKGSIVQNIYVNWNKLFNKKSNCRWAQTTWRPYGVTATCMMTSSNGNIFRVTGHLCGEFTGDRWIPRTKASDAELWCFLWSASE